MFGKRLSAFVLMVLTATVAACGLPVLTGAQDSSTPAALISDIQFEAKPEGGADGDPFIFQSDAGTSTTFTLVVANASAFAMGLHAFTTNTYSAPNGGLSLELEGAEPVPPTSWLDFPSQDFALEPGDQQSTTFTVSIPDDTAAGEYAAAIAVETVDSYAVEGTSMFRQKIRKVLPVYIVVAGDIVSSFSLGEPYIEFVNQNARLRIPFTNTGNTRVIPGGELTIYDQSGAEILATEIQMRAVYGGHETFVELSLPTLPPPGDYLLSLELKDQLSDATASLDNVPLVVPEAPAAPTAGVEVTAVTVTPNADPIQFANIAVELNNSGAVVPAARLTVSVTRNGEPVEDFVLADSLTVPEGALTVEQRYIPITGFESGTWSFSVLLESIDPSSGLVTTLVTQEDVATLEVP